MRKSWVNWPVLLILITSASPIIIAFACQLLVFQTAVQYSLLAFLWLGIGLAYVHLFEYTHHRGPMHHRWKVPWPCFGWLNKFLGAIWHSHLYIHHRIFSGKNFRSNKEEDLRNIIGPFWFFPIAFLAHYVFLLIFVNFSLLSINSLNFFAMGVLIRYLYYEISHFFLHKDNNKIDQLSSMVPFWNTARKRKIHYHKKHHKDVTVNFSVCMPRLDPLLRTAPTKNPV